MGTALGFPHGRGSRRKSLGSLGRGHSPQALQISGRAGVRQGLGWCLGQIRTLCRQVKGVSSHHTKR